MPSFKYLILIFLFIICFSEAAPLSCFEIISSLSSKDKCLQSRLSLKVLIASQNKNSSSFVDTIKKNQFQCNGSYYGSSYTMSWVTEVFEGLSQQFTEYKYYDDYDGLYSGYQLDLNLMNILKNVPFYVIIQMRNTGRPNQIWTIEKLPSRAGYRIYQSRQNAYSLKAWLSEDIISFFEDNNGEIMRPKNEQVVDARIKNLTNGRASLKNLTKLPNEFQPLLPYLNYIKNINQTVVMNNFRKAWTKYGQGKILNQSEFEEYYTELKKIVEFLNADNSSSKPFPQEIYNSWIGLFGAVDDVMFPNIPINALKKFWDLDLTQKYRFEILPKYLSSKDVNEDCRVNANILIGNNKY